MNISVAYENASSEHKTMIDELLADTKANNNLAPIDLSEFWQEQEKATQDYFNAKQCALGAILTRECIFDELGIKTDWWRLYQSDPVWAFDISKQYNDISEKIVGRRLLPETAPDQDLQYPPIKQLHDIFESENVWEGGATGSWWLKPSADNVDELKSLLDRVETRLDNLRDFILPENWDIEKKRLTELGCEVPLFRQQRGPCTFATSIYGTKHAFPLLR
jgi:uroporphyrinogen decarboxylase